MTVMMSLNTWGGASGDLGSDEDDSNVKDDATVYRNHVTVLGAGFDRGEWRKLTSRLNYVDLNLNANCLPVESDLSSELNESVKILISEHI